MREFILRDPDFYSLASRFTFEYREFTPLIDYCEVRWNKKKKGWEFVKYLLFNRNLDKLIEKKNTFYLPLSIPGYDWGSLFSKMEETFIEEFKMNRSDEEMDYIISHDYDRYVNAREEYFNVQTNKENVIKSWFVLTEESCEQYFSRISEDLHRRIITGKKFSI